MNTNNLIGFATRSACSMLHRLTGTFAVLSLALTPVAVRADVIYVHTDHLGNPAAYSNGNGELVAREFYMPYGESLMMPGGHDQPDFTGHVRDSSTGLVYMQARYYDPEIGRFLSVDPVTFVADKPEHFNRYWYAIGNPLAVIDPDGREWRFLMSEENFKTFETKVIRPMRATETGEALYQKISSSDKIVAVFTNSAGQNHAGAVDQTAAQDGTGSNSYINIDMENQPAVAVTDRRGNTAMNVQEVDQTFVHEAAHSADHIEGTLDRSPASDSSFPNKAEEKATATENEYRKEQGALLRDGY